MDDDKPRIEFNWVQASAASLAAVTSAVLLSTFGVAGTLIGAAVGSLALTVGNALYSYSINATKHRVATAQSVAAARIGLARARTEETSAHPSGGASDSARSEHGPPKLHRDPAHAGRESHPDPSLESRRTMLAALPWKRIALVSTGVFVAAMLMILAFELLTGRALSSFTGSDDRRNSIPGWGDDGGAEKDPAPQDEDAPLDQESGAPDAEDVTPPSESEPTADSTLPASPTGTAESSPGSTVPSTDSTVPPPSPTQPSPLLQPSPIQPSPSEPSPTG